MIREQWHIFHPLTQWRQMQRNHAQSIEQVIAQHMRPNRLFRIAVCG